MGRRSKQQIQEDGIKLLKEKNKVLAVLNHSLSIVTSLSNEEQIKLNDFLILFFRCETVYKTLYPEMKRLRDNETIDVKQLRLNVQMLEAALKFFGIKYDDAKVKRIFGAENSFKIWRNNIVHGLKKESVDEVISNYDEITALMEGFLSDVSNAEPQ